MRLFSPALLVLAGLLSLADVPSASAGEIEYDVCLEAASLPPRRAMLTVVGPNSRVQADTYGSVVTGLWELACDGTSEFDERDITTLPAKPPVGRVLDKDVPRAALRCFVESCVFPENVCPGRVNDDPIVELCGGGYITKEALTAGPGTPVEEPPPPAVVITPKDNAPPFVIGEPDDPLAMPPPPTEECSTSGALAAESRAHLDLGNQAELAGDLHSAAAEYRAALTLSPCNALAWTAMGMLGSRMSRPDRAIQALTVAVSLNPSHYGAATSLGSAYEAMGQKELAAEAFRAALAARPDHRPAVRGLERVTQ